MTDDEQVIIKAKGANNDELNLKDFKDMYNKKNIVTKKIILSLHMKKVLSF